MKALLDGDLLVYGAGFKVSHTEYSVTNPANNNVVTLRYKAEMEEFCERSQIPFSSVEKTTKNAPLSHALYTLKVSIGEIVEESGCDTYEVFLSGDDNFRKHIDLSYKMNRKDVPKPAWFDEMRAYIMNNHPFNLSVSDEADDQLGIVQCTSPDATTVLCSRDKDLDMIPGWHYNWSKVGKYHVTKSEAAYNFYQQLLTGDRVDNIKCLSGIGPKKAQKILEVPEDEWPCAVFEAHKKWLMKNMPGIEGSHKNLINHMVYTRLDHLGRLLWIRRSQGELYRFPRLPQYV